MFDIRVSQSFTPVTSGVFQPIGSQKQESDTDPFLQLLVVPLGKRMKKK